MSDDTSAPPPAIPQRVSRARAAARHAKRVALATVVLGTILLVAAAIAVATLWHSESGTRWALGRVPAVTATGVQGSLGGGDLRIAHLHVAAGPLQVDIDDARLEGLALHWRPGHGLWLAVHADRLSARQAVLAWHATPASGEAGPSVPKSLRSAVTLDLPRFEVARLEVPGLAPFTDVHAGLSLGGEDGSRHVVDTLGFEWEKVQAQAQLRVGADAPLKVEAHIAAHNAAAVAGAAGAAPPDLDTVPASELPWTASATVAGPLETLDATLSLRGVARTGHEAPEVDAQARLRPFQPFPLGDVTLRTQAFDLAALSARAPSTRLDGRVALASTRPVAAVVDLRNQAPAPWSAGGVPVARLTGRLESPWSADPITVPALQADLDDGHGAAGRLSGSARWSGGTATAKLALDQVALARLDARLAPLVLGGNVSLEATGLRAPEAAASAPAVPASAVLKPAAPPPGASAFSVGPAGVRTLSPTAPVPRVASAPAGATTAATVATRDWQVHIVADLHGPLAVGRTTPVPATLALDARVRADHIGIAPSQLVAGPTRVALQGAFTRRPGAESDWHGDAHATVAAFDPAAWWRPAAGVVANRGETHLDGTLDLLLDHLPAAGGAGWAGLRGEAHATLAGSRVAGTAIDGRAALVAGNGPWQSSGELHAGTNAVRWQASASPVAGGPADRAQLDVDAPALNELAPLAALLPGLAPEWPTKGRASARLSANGTHLLAHAAAASPWRGLAIDTHGEANDVAAPRGQVGRLQWDLQASPAPNAPLNGHAALRDLRAGNGRVESAEATLTGTLAEHQLRVQATAPVQPPAWVAQLARLAPGTGTRLDAQVAGRWEDGPAGRWTGRLGTLALRSASAASAAAASPPGAASGPAPWLDVAPLDLALETGEGLAPRSVHTSAGKASIAGLQLAWEPITWSTSTTGRPARVDADVKLSPVVVAPLLARAQPELGWQGDLALGAHAHVGFDGAWHVAAEVARAGGDLVVSEALKDPVRTGQPLGLTAARVSVTADAGRWQAQAELAGTRVGRLSATAATRTAAEALPDASSPLSGGVKADVEDLGAWGAWLPPGWRAGGALAADVRVGGRLGAPELTGTVEAHRLVLRNPLEGVYGHDGEALLRFTGDRAVIERFTLQAGTGSGTLSASGEVALGAQPAGSIALHASQFQLLGRIDRRVVASGDAKVVLAPDTLSVEGRVHVDEALIDLGKGNAPTLDADVQVQGADDADGADGASQRAPAAGGRKVRLALALELGDQLKLRGRGVDTRLTGEVQLTAPNGRLAAKGRVLAVDGQYTAYGQRLDIQRGQVTFTGPVDDPALDIRAVRKNVDVVVGVAITGTALQPHVRLFSEPEMADVDKLSWLMLGRAPEALGRADTALLQSAALALFAGEGESPSDQLLHRIGLTDFSVRQDTSTTSAGETTRETVVSLGRQLSRHWYLGYEQGINTAMGTVQLIYRLGQTVTVRAQSGGENSLDVIWSWRWN